MEKPRYSDSLILSILKQAGLGLPVPELCREHGITLARFTNGAKYGATGIADFRREGLAIEADFSLPSIRVIRRLSQLIEWRGKTSVIRCGDGPEFISHVFSSWAKKHSIRIEYIQPGNPQ